MVSVVIPAYNEEKTIGDVVRICRRSSLVREVIVVDDGSQDSTAGKAEAEGARVVRLEKNQGKGKALEMGVRHTKDEILLFMDADLFGVNENHIASLLEPVIDKSVDMTIGVIDRGKMINNWFNRFESPFSGVRVLKKGFWEVIPNEFKKGYFVESALTYFAKGKKLKTKGVVLRGVKHYLKEQKHGFWLGFSYRLKMMGEIVLANFLLRIHV